MSAWRLADSSLTPLPLCTVWDSTAGGLKGALQCWQSLRVPFRLHLGRVDQTSRVLPPGAPHVLCLQVSLSAPGALRGLRPSSCVHTLSAPPRVHIAGFHCRFDHPQQCVCTMKMRVSAVVWGDCTVRNTHYVPAKCSVSQQTGSRNGRKMKSGRGLRRAELSVRPKVACLLP